MLPISKWMPITIRICRYDLFSVEIRLQTNELTSSGLFQLSDSVVDLIQSSQQPNVVSETVLKELGESNFIERRSLSVTDVTMQTWMQSAQPTSSIRAFFKEGHSAQIVGADFKANDSGVQIEVTLSDAGGSISAADAAEFGLNGAAIDINGATLAISDYLSQDIKGILDSSQDQNGLVQIETSAAQSASISTSNLPANTHVQVLGSAEITALSAQDLNQDLTLTDAAVLTVTDYIDEDISVFDRGSGASSVTVETGTASAHLTDALIGEVDALLIKGNAGISAGISAIWHPTDCRNWWNLHVKRFPVNLSELIDAGGTVVVYKVFMETDEASICVSEIANQRDYIYVDHVHHAGD